MRDLNWDTIAYPAKPTRVYQDTRRIGTLVLTAERREELREAQRKWLAGEGRRKHAEACKRWRAKQ